MDVSPMRPQRPQTRYDGILEDSTNEEVLLRLHGDLRAQDHFENWLNTARKK
jgi:hypothetical protein